MTYTGHRVSQGTAKLDMRTRVTEGLELEVWENNTEAGMERVYTSGLRSFAPNKPFFTTPIFFWENAF